MNIKTSFAYYISECDNESFKCPIGLDLMEDPVFLNDGHTYERCNIKTHLLKSNKSPMTNVNFTDNPILIDNNSLKNQISEWKNNNTLKKEIIFEDDKVKFKDDKENVTCEKIELFQNDFTYIGSVKNGLKHGKGKLIFTYNHISYDYSYDGEWYNNKKHGKGILINNDIKTISKWYEDKKNGISIIIFDNVYPPFDIYNVYSPINNKIKENCIIQCKFKQDEISNSVIIFYEDGRKYIGQVNNNFYHNGNGEIHFLDGTIYKGEWNDDKIYPPNGEIIYKSCITKNSKEFILSLQKKINKLNYQIDKISKQVNHNIKIEVNNKVINIRFEVDDKSIEFLNNIFDILFLKIIHQIKLSLIFKKEYSKYDDDDNNNYISEDSSDDEYIKENYFKGSDKLKLNKRHFFKIMRELLSESQNNFCKSEININICKNNNLKNIFNSKKKNLVIKIKSVFSILKLHLKNIFYEVKIDYDVIICICTFLEVIIAEILELSGCEKVDKFVDNEIENSDRSSILSNSNILLKIDIDTIKSSIKSKNDLHDLISNKLKIEI
jgi:hypothetical protein